MRLKIITHEKVVFDDEVDEIYTKGVDGEFGILKNHIPYMSALDIGVTKVVQGKNIKKFTTMGGVFQFKDDVAQILTPTAEYSDDIDGDLSHLKYKEFLIAIEKVANECYRVLKKDKFCAIVMGDTRKNGMVQPLGFEVMQRFINAGFKQKEIIIKEQHNCKATGFWKTNSKKYNFLLLAHEYIFIFKK